MDNKGKTQRKKPIYKQIWLWVIVLVIVIISGIFIGIELNNEKNDSSLTSVKTSSSSVPAEYKKALEKADLYSSKLHMSKKGILRRLISDKEGDAFTARAAKYALKQLKADYNKNALEKAKIYQSQNSMSKNDILKQLTSENGDNFTMSEGQFAINNLPE